MIVPFKKEHLLKIALQDGQDMELLTASVLETFYNGDSYSAIYGGEVLVCAGILKIHEGRGVAWSCISRNVGVHLFDITKIMRKFILMSPLKRIEMDVCCDFTPGHRMAKLLGFTIEAERRASYSPDGKDYALYSLVK
jgi:hypothetical protein